MTLRIKQCCSKIFSQSEYRKTALHWIGFLYLGLLESVVILFYLERMQIGRAIVIFWMGNSSLFHWRLLYLEVDHLSAHPDWAMIYFTQDQL